MQLNQLVFDGKKVSNYYQFDRLSNSERTTEKDGWLNGWMDGRMNKRLGG